MDDPAQLRQRATVLRRASAAVSNSSAFVLPQRSGDDVWIGPTAGHFREDLRVVLSKLRSASDMMTHAAATLEARADLAEAARGVVRVS